MKRDAGNAIRAGLANVRNAVMQERAGSRNPCPFFQHKDSYVVVHIYRPPDEFIEAVLNGPRPGSVEYQTLVKKLEGSA